MPPSDSPRRVVLSGVQPSGTLHLGNYFGALRQHVERSQAAATSGEDAFFFVVNYHALTSLKDAAALRQHTFDVALDYLALGFDPTHAALFLQSDVPAVTELAWIFATLTPVADMENGLAYKDKVQNGLAANCGLFTYPILQAADILIYGGDAPTVVPVGADQRQNLEIARDVAARFNAAFPGPDGAPTFALPEALILPDVAVVPGLDGRKMSKSYGNTIGLFDEGGALKKKVAAIVTDSTPLEEPKDPEKDNVFALIKLFATPEETAELAAKYRAGGYGYGHAKGRLRELIDAHFADARERRKELAARPEFVRDVLLDGAKKARRRADAVMATVRARCGIAF